MTGRSGILGGTKLGPQYLTENTTKAQNFQGAFIQQAINTGAGSATLDALTGTGPGTLLIQGTETKTLEDLTGSATGRLAIAGTASATLDDLTGSATGRLAIAGTASATLDDLTGTGTATMPLADDDVAARVQRAKGAGGVSSRKRRRKPVEIAARLRVRAPRLFAAGEAMAPPEGELRGRVNLQFRLRAIGTAGALGRAQLPAPWPGVRARAFIAPCGDGRLVAAPAVRAIARHDHFTEQEIEQALTLLLAA